MSETILRYPGGKNKLLPTLRSYLDPYLNVSDSFCDLFVGGGSVILDVATRYPNHKLYLNDKDYGIYSIWKVLSSTSEKDINSLCNFITIEPTIDYFYELRNKNANSIIESAYQAIFFNRCCFSGINITREKKDKNGNLKLFKSNPIGGKDQKSKYKVNCRYNSKKLISQILKINKLIKNRSFVSNFDSNNLLLKLDDLPIYADPPYWHKAEDLYNTYMVDSEHRLLSQNLKNRKNWVLSYDNAEEIKKIYYWAKIAEINTKYSINSNNINWKTKTELLITRD